MEDEIFEKYIKAGKISSYVREESKKFIKVDVSLFKIAEKIEKMIKEKGAEIAFPVNLSLNEYAAHCTPTKNDETKLKKDDILKVDIGIHIDGYIADTAYTVCFNEKHNKLIEASNKALEEALKLCKPNALLSDISTKIEETIKSFGFNPVSNLTGHGLDEYNLHAEPQIPNVKFKSSYKLKENQVIALEPFSTNGAGRIKESEPAVIFSLINKKPVRNQDARKIISFAEPRFGLPFTERWLPVDSLFKIRIALRELRDKRIIYDYPPLKEVANGLISQAEHTVIVREEPIITTL